MGVRLWRVRVSDVEREREEKGHLRGEGKESYGLTVS